MKKLEKYSKNGYHMEVFKREDNVGIFAVLNNDHVAGYEVIIIREREETELFGNLMEATEYAPSNEDFGKFGFFY